MILEKNMEYKIIIQNERIFAKDLSKIGEKERKLVFQKIEKLKSEWVVYAQVKRLKNYKVADFRVRLWNYRILFNFSLEKGEITLLRILHRSKLY